MRQTLPFAAPGSRDQHGTVRAHAAILCKCTAHARDLLQPSQLLPYECALPVRSSYCHRNTVLPIRSMRGIATCLTKVLRRPARCTSPDDLAASLGRIGCLGVLRVPAYSLRRRSPVLLGFFGLRRPVGDDLAPIVQIHAASERLRSRCLSAPSRLGRDTIGALRGLAGSG